MCGWCRREECVELRGEKAELAGRIEELQEAVAELAATHAVDLKVHAEDLEEKQSSHDRHEEALHEAWGACESCKFTHAICRCL